MAKKGKGKKKGKKGKKAKSASADPMLVRMQQIIDDTASRKRDESINSVLWLDECREWFRENIARAFDDLREVDKSGSGSVSIEDAVNVLAAFGHERESMETLAIAMDLDDDGLVNYCAPPQISKCYGGGLLELVDKGLERILMGQRQELADIDAEHIKEKDLLKSLGIKAYRMYRKTGELPETPVPAATAEGGTEDAGGDLDIDLDPGGGGDDGDGEEVDGGGGEEEQ